MEIQNGACSYFSPRDCLYVNSAKPKQNTKKAYLVQIILAMFYDDVISPLCCIYMHHWTGSSLI